MHTFLYYLPLSHVLIAVMFNQKWVYWETLTVTAYIQFTCFIILYRLFKFSCAFSLYLSFSLLNPLTDAPAGIPFSFSSVISNHISFVNPRVTYRSYTVRHATWNQNTTVGFSKPLFFIWVYMVWNKADLNCGFTPRATKCAPPKMYCFRQHKELWLGQGLW